MSPLVSYTLLEVRRLAAALVFSFSDFIKYGNRLRSFHKLRRETQLSEMILIGGGITSNCIDRIKAISQNCGIIALNRHASSVISNDLIPNFYLIVDPFFLDIKNADTIVLIEYIHRYKIAVLIPAGAPEEFIDSLKILNIEIYFFNGRFSRFLGFSSPLLPRATVGMSLLMGLNICKFLGMNKIYLFGFNSDLFRYMKVDQNNRLSIEYPSFGKINHKDLNMSVSQYFLNQYFFFNDLEIFAKKFKGHVVIFGESIIDSFCKR